MQERYYRSARAPKPKDGGNLKVFGKLGQGGEMKTWNDRNPEKKRVNYRKQFEV